MEMEKDPKEAGFLALSANAPFIEVQLSWTHIKSSAMCCLPENDLSPYHMEWNNCTTKFSLNSLWSHTKQSNEQKDIALCVDIYSHMCD